jgi:hypothetical protein
MILNEYSTTSDTPQPPAPGHDVAGEPKLDQSRRQKTEYDLGSHLAQFWVRCHGRGSRIWDVVRMSWSGRKSGRAVDDAAHTPIAGGVGWRALQCGKLLGTAAKHFVVRSKAKRPSQSS